MADTEVLSTLARQREFMNALLDAMPRTLARDLIVTMHHFMLLAEQHRDLDGPHRRGMADGYEVMLSSLRRDLLNHDVLGEFPPHLHAAVSEVLRERD